MSGICNVSLRVEKRLLLQEQDFCFKPDAAEENTSRSLKKAYVDFIHLLDPNFSPPPFLA